MKRVNLIRHLIAHNCYLLREGGRHSMWANRTNGEQQAVPRHNEIKDHLAKKICRSLGVPDPPG